MPRIAIVSNLYPPQVLGGYEILCHQVAKALLARGWDVRVLTSTHGGADSGIVDGIPVDRELQLFLPFGQAPKIDHRVRARITEENFRSATEWYEAIRPDLVFFWSQLRLTVGAVRAAQERDLPSVWTFNDANIASYASAPWRSAKSAVADRMLFRNATLDGISLTPSTCISEVVKADIQAKVPMKEPAKCKVIHQGVPIEELPPKDEPGQAHAPFRLLYAGQLHPYKGVIDAVRAAANLGSKVVLRLAGAGDKDYEAELVKATGGNVEFLGKLDRAALVQEYHWADALIFPSTWREPFGLTHLEAMACGTPVISTANGGQGEFLVHEENSLVVAPESPTEIAAAVNRLIEDDELRLRLAKNGMDLARTKYSLDRYVDDLEGWLKENY